MRKHTSKRAAIEREYNKVKAQIMQDRPHCCAGCGTYAGMITFSHRIPRSRRRDLIADINNIDLMCHNCHNKVETGKYNELLNGNEIVRYIEENEPELLKLKQLRAEFLAN